VLLTRDAFRKHWIGESADRTVKYHLKSELLQISTLEGVGIQPQKSESKRGADLEKILGSDLKIYQGTYTDGKWETVLPESKKIMILPSKHRHGYIQGAEDVTSGAFLDNAGDVLKLLNGLKYRSDDSDISIYYLEV
jgi:hypothetical protein